ncbi:hypothetical protein EG328_005268 [Venturia inaequalis]|uniref:Methyltransferase domain-containing protein n=1 Tax=Venturia inaequalis TaxID=5025 RepID=A0A8H3VS67_VENIN|nr:hypothetical protein EG328_005268 [Venturia inaequalis]KAE9992602.1 hypothetical protein EG327_008477 [Venturia inaequalis]RDI89767.1 hypothetical protein Vi05172_g426 [Venturia inaequalis]
MSNSTQETQKPDHWSESAYTTAASFVPKLTTKVLQYLSPQPGDQILDLGCGDGLLTSHIATSVLPGGTVKGIDASPSFIKTATQKYTTENCTFQIQDVTTFSPKTTQDFPAGKYDKIFSNAALHWILRNPATRLGVLESAFAALTPGGKFVFEMGGHGNVAETHSALILALITLANLSPQAARDKSPWFFPDAEWMRATLSKIGFEVEISEIEYRPTEMTTTDSDGKGGLEGWVRLMGACFLEGLGKEKVDEVVELVCEGVKESVTREDGGQWLGYVRLRVVARKPAV